MKKIVVLFLLIITTTVAFGQSNSGRFHFGVKAGIDYLLFSNKTNYASSTGDGGYNVAVFLSPKPKKGLSYRTELMYIHQNLDVQKDGPTPEEINSNYIAIPHLMTFTFARLIQVQAGGVMSILINAKRTNYTIQNVIDAYNRIKYGAAAGVEIHPFKGVIAGVRYNLDITNAYKNGMVGYPFNLSTAGLDKGVFQLTIGYQL